VPSVGSEGAQRHRIARKGEASEVSEQARSMVDWKRAAQTFSAPSFAVRRPLAARYCSIDPLPIKIQETSQSKRRVRLESLLFFRLNQQKFSPFSALICPASAGCIEEGCGVGKVLSMRVHDPEATCRGPQMLRVVRWAAWCRIGIRLTICLGILCLSSDLRVSAQQKVASAQSVQPRANRAAIPHSSLLNAAWQAVGPAQIASQSYGTVTGRVTSIAIDPADPFGNTVYLGTTGGVWKSINAAGTPASVTFTPLTDTLPVFSANAGTAVLPSLSIGAVSVSQVSGNDVILAGTGDPNDASDSYYGEGILRLTDGGLTWSLAQQSMDSPAVNHSFVGLSVAGFAWSGTTPTTVVAALSQSAEGVLVNAPDTRYSIMGLYYSQDAGKTWQMGIIEDGSGQYVQMASSATYPGNAATAVVWNPVRQMFYAAVRYHGYYSSPDGVLWTRLAIQPGTGLTMTACPTNPNSTGNPTCPLFRGALAVQPTTGDTFALTVDANNLDQGLWQDACKLSGGSCTTTPAFNTPLPSTPLEIGSGSTPTAIPQADYNLSLAAVATGTGTTADTLLFAGTVDLYRCSLAAGCVLRNTTNATNGCNHPAMVSPAQHAIATLSGAGTGATPVLLYVGNDGGLWRSLDGVDQQQTPCSTDDATHFQNLNSGLGSLAEVVSFAQNPTDPATLLAGVGANGTAATGTATTSIAWSQIATGEGGTVAIDPANPQNWYVSTEAGVSLRYCGNGSACAAADFTGTPTIGYAQVSNDASVIDPPFLLDPALPSDVLIGTCRVWRGPAANDSTWPGSNNISPIFGGPQNSTCNATTNPNVRSLAAGGPTSVATSPPDQGSTVLYAGLAGSLDGGGNFGGHLFANYAAGSASSSSVWTDVAKSPVTNVTGAAFNPGGFDISSVVADPHDSTGMTVYATVMGFAGNGTSTAQVYRSINGGASWTNITSNLPNSPANSLLVDPNDANTLYVAMDDGVWVTTQVSTCATPTMNCWSVYGTTLPNAPVVGLQASAAMATGDGRFGELRAATYGRGIWQIPLLTAAYPAAPAMTLNPTSLTFAAQAVSTASAAQTITVTNSGNAPLTIPSLNASANFTEIDSCVASSPIAAGATCSVQVAFLPTTTGSLPGTLTIYGNVSGGQATASLTGMGTTAATIVLSPPSVTYSGTNVGATSIAQNIVVANTGGVTATLGTPTVTSNFTITANTCTVTLAASNSCTVSVAFQPTASGTLNGSFSITDSVGTQTASLTGVGLLPATDTLSPLTVAFAPQQLNTASTPRQVTLTNNGDAALTLIAAQITSGDFTVVNGCGNSLNGHSTCSLLISYVPTIVGAETGALTVTDAYRSQTVTLSGTGVAPPGVSLSPLSTVAFAPTGVGLAAPSQTVTLTNNGGLPLTIQSIATTGDFAIVAGSNTCGSSLAVGAQCSAQLVFAPTATAIRTGTFTVLDNAPSSPQTLQLTGTGVDFTLTANGTTTQTISAGAEAVYPLLLSSAAGVPGTVAFTCAGAPANATCIVNPSSSPLGGTATITVTVATDVASLHLPLLPGQQPIFWLATLLPLGLLGLGRRRARHLGAVAMFCCVLLVAGCAASRLIPQSDATTPVNPVVPTPSGTYNLTVSGTSAGLTHSIGLTLIVQ
jgi:hypothetical protein